jgi:hypothetical protein
MKTNFWHDCRFAAIGVGERDPGTGSGSLHAAYITSCAFVTASSGDRVRKLSIARLSGGGAKMHHNPLCCDIPERSR